MPRTDHQSPAARRLLLVSLDPELHATVSRLAALVGVAVEPYAGDPALAITWRAAAFVAVGADQAQAVATAGMPRRDGVVVVASDLADEALWRQAVTIGAAGVLVLPEHERELVEQLADWFDPAAGAGLCVGVIGGCGGAGASTFAAALARTAVERGSAILLDADPFGGGIDVLLGAEGLAGARWPAFAATRGRLPAGALSEGLPRVDGVCFLSWDRAARPALDPEAVAAVAGAARRGFRTAVVDLPRHLDPCAAALAAQADVVTVLVPAGVRATAAAVRTVDELRAISPRLALVVRKLAADGAPRGARLAPREVATALDVALVADLPYVPAVATAAQRGDPPLRRLRGPLVPACRAVLRAAEARAAVAP